MGLLVNKLIIQTLAVIYVICESDAVTYQLPVYRERSVEPDSILGRPDGDHIRKRLINYWGLGIPLLLLSPLI